MKIYIVGTVGSGKSTFAKRLSELYQIPYYELDNVVWEQHPTGDIKRNETDIQKLFEEIITKDTWIIEDVGRSIFQAGLNKADKIIYLNISPMTLKKRIVFRWLKQRFGIEATSYQPNLKMLNQMNQWCNSDLKKRPNLLDKLKSYPAEFICLNEKTMKDFNLDNKVISK